MRRQEDRDEAKALRSGNALDIKIEIGDQTFPGRLPFIPTRFRINSAYWKAFGRVVGEDDDDQAAMNIDDVVAVFSACIGLCWVGPASWPSFRSAGRDAVDFGEGVMHFLLEDGHTQKDIIECGRALREIIRDSLPTVEEVEEQADFSEAQGEGSTKPTSG